MTASTTFDVIFVGAEHNGLIAARYLAEDSGSMCLLGQPPIQVNPPAAPSESFMDDPEDFKKRRRTHPTYGQPKGEHLTATRAVIASTTPDWLCGRLLRDALDVAESNRARGRRYAFRRGGLRSRRWR